MKLVIVVLIIVALVFAVGAWASFRKPKPAPSKDPEKEAKTRKRTSFEDFLSGLSLPTGGAGALKKSVYRAGDPEEVVGKAEKLRQVKLRITHRDGCSILIRYTDDASDDKDLKKQETHLPRREDEGKDNHKDEATIVLLTTGGKVHFDACTQHKSGCPARLEVVK